MTFSLQIALYYRIILIYIYIATDDLFASMKQMNGVAIELRSINFDCIILFPAPIKTC